MSARFGLTWWGRAWVDALETASGVDAGRLSRGRSYAREDRVESLQLHPGSVAASVRGSRRLSYRTHLDVRTYDDGAWTRVVDVIAAQAGRTAALLDGDLDPSVLDDAREAGVELLPSPGDLRTRCSCPDHEDPCKHAAAVCYLVAEALDDDPFVLFQLRGRSRDDLIAALRAARGRGRGDDRSADDAALAKLVAAGPDGTGADGGEIARDAWVRERGDLPPIGDLPAAPGRPASWPEDPPVTAPFDTPGLLVLAADAARRAWTQLRGDGDAGLRLSADADLARRRSVTLETGGPAIVSGAAGGDRASANRAVAWSHGGQEALDLLDESPWRPPVADMAAARAAIAAAGVATSVLTITNNRITGPGFQLRLSRAGSWWRFEKKAGRWELASGAADAPDDLLDPSA